MGIGNIADTGMQAAMANMEVISNNIANANTWGYKKSSINFADIYPSLNGSSGTQIGLGVNIASISQDFSSNGSILSSSGLDLSIPNNGFFVMHNPVSGQISYTRAGHFQQSPDGHIISSITGARLQGYPAQNGVIPQGGSVTDISFNNTALPAKASANITTNLNLDSNSAILTGPFDPTNQGTFNFQSTASIYDSLGNTHNVVSYYVKTANNTWNVNVYVDGTSAATGTASFNTDGSLNTTTGLSNISFPLTNGAASPQTLNMSFTGSTQTGTSSVVNQAVADGYQAGSFTGISVDSNGMLWMQYTNSQQLLAGQISLATFKSTQGLADIGNMSWVATADSGQAILNQSNSIGNIEANSLEQSNVDLTTEMVNLINAQHTFQANAQVEQTYSEIMQTVIQL